MKLAPGRGSFFFFGYLVLISDCSTVELKENTTIIVLGASGDLAKKKTVCTGSSLFYGLVNADVWRSSRLSLALLVDPRILRFRTRRQFVDPSNSTETSSSPKIATS